MPTVLMPDGTHIAVPDNPDPAMLKQLQSVADAQRFYRAPSGVTLVTREMLRALE